MAGITLEDFSQSVAYREIFGLGEQQGLEQGLEKGLEQGRAQGLEKGLEQGLKTGELEITLRQLRRRCGALTATQETRIRALPLPRLEMLAEALLNFQGSDELDTWLSGD